MLRAWPKPEIDREALPFRIAQINDQRGAFKNITEASLLEEIERPESSGKFEDEDLEVGSSDEDLSEPKTQRQRVMVIRDDMLKQLA